MERKFRGVILAGGTGTRLRPASLQTNKHLLNILNEQMILFPLRTLISLGVKDILLISGGGHVGGFSELLGDGSQYGASIRYQIQKEASGIAQALGLAEDFAHGETTITILGDNVYGDITKVFIGSDFDHPLHPNQAAILVKKMPDASRFGVLMGNSFVGENHYRIVEKPQNISTGDVVTGLYVYPPSVFDIIKTLKPSARGEYEISDVNNYYLENNNCRIYRLHDEFWNDCGTRDSLYETTEWVYKNNK